MTVRMTVELSADTIGPALAGLVARGEDLTPAMDAIGSALVTSTLLRFERGQDPEGTPWLPSQRALETGGQTLIKTGRLRDSITHRATADSVVVGTNLVYAAIHQLGGQAGRGRRTRIPARPYLGVSADDRDEILGTLADFIAGASEAGAAP